MARNGYYHEQKARAKRFKLLSKFVSTDETRPSLWANHHDGEYVYASDGQRAVRLEAQAAYPDVKRCFDDRAHDDGVWKPLPEVAIAPEYKVRKADRPQHAQQVKLDARTVDAAKLMDFQNFENVEYKHNESADPGTPVMLRFNGGEGLVMPLRV